MASKVSEEEKDHVWWVSLVSGFNSGVIGLLVGHPFDTLKVFLMFLHIEFFGFFLW